MTLDPEDQDPMTSDTVTSQKAQRGYFLTKLLMYANYDERRRKKIFC